MIEKTLCERKNNYIETGGLRCFHCNSEDITTDPKKEMDESGIRVSVSCDNCSEEWEELYTLDCIVE